MTRPLLEPRPLALDVDNLNYWTIEEVKKGKTVRFWVGGGVGLGKDEGLDC